IALYICFVLATTIGLEPYISVFITAGVLIGLGFLFWRFMLLPVLNHSPLIFFQVGVGLVLVIERILEAIFTPNVQAVPSFITLNRVFIGAIPIETGYLIAVLVSLVICIGFYVMLQLTDFGRAIRAVAHCPDTASLMGINVSQIRFRTLSLAFVFVAITGALLAPMWSLRPIMGLHLTLMALIILIVGGMGHFLGTLIIAFVIGISQGLGQFYLGGSYALAIPYGIFILVMFARPQGLFGTRRLE
ncbi:MAG: branched-chain amino acid ABC transporter permease, partial [Thermodesulfobacteriota bacterium]|nr:branched-chain amino acid ABC transporter permease [Thermodesulfobacteriota bacterium]